MRTEEELLELLKNANFDSYLANVNINDNNTIQLTTIEELIKFSNQQNINTMFYNYTFITVDALSITEDVTSTLKLDEDTLMILQEKFEEYNNSLLNLDFDKPIYLNVYCIYQGIIFFIQEEDYWFEEQGIEMPEIACVELLTKYGQDIIKEKKNKEQMINDARNKLRQQILNDEEFQKCSNMQLRRMYANKMFKNNENQKLFYSKKDGLYDITINEFIEDVWREYKNSLKK